MYNPDLFPKSFFILKWVQKGPSFIYCKIKVFYKSMFPLKNSDSKVGDQFKFCKFGSLQEKAFAMQILT